MSQTVVPEHICWSYDDSRIFDGYARLFVHAGLAAGEQVWYVRGEPSGGLLDLQPRDGASWHANALRVLSPQETYAGDAVIDPAAQTAVYVTATERALAAGFTGLRVVADATAFVRTEAQLDAFARYEYAIGRYMRTAPVRALCVYDRAELGDEVVAQLACMHRRTNAVDVPFQLHPGPTRDAVVLSGELDSAAEQMLATALERADLRPVRGRIVVQGEGLGFVDHRCLRVLQRYARRRDATAVVRTRLTTVPPMVELLRLSHLRAETLR